MDERTLTGDIAFWALMAVGSCLSVWLFMQMFTAIDQSSANLGAFLAGIIK